MLNYVPPVDITVAFSGLSVLAFENQRWFKARQQGLRGQNVLIGELVDWTFRLNTYFRYGILIYLGFWLSWQIAIAVFLISWSIGFIYSFGSTIIFGGDKHSVWVFSTVLIWPLSIWILIRVLALT